jgi:hypothetical protein
MKSCWAGLWSRIVACVRGILGKLVSNVGSSCRVLGAQARLLHLEFSTARYANLISSRYGPNWSVFGGAELESR